MIQNATWEECNKCGEVIIPAKLDKALNRERYRRLGLLTPDEIKAVRVRAGLTQIEMAQFVDIGEKTYTRWESGRSLQRKSSDTLIRLADRHPDLFLQMEAQRDPNRENVIRGYFDELPQLKGDNPQAMAAHGGELPPGLCEVLRERLRVIAKGRKKA